MGIGDSYRPQARDRSRSPRRRSHSPRRRRSYSPRSRSRSRDSYRRSDARNQSPRHGDSGSGSYNRGGSSYPSRNYEDRSQAREQMMASVRDSSQQERRVYVGNLAYDVKWHHLKDFMRQAGEVIFADVLLLPNGMSKGCGIVEYATRDQAMDAVNTLSNQNLLGRLVYVREDREAEPRFAGSTPSRGGFGGSSRGGGFDGGRGGFSGGIGGGSSGTGRQIFVNNLPYTVGWQELKDFFRQAAQTGTILRADVHQGPDGRPKGSGIVAFETSEDAQNAISQFNGYDWQGRMIEVREDRFANAAGGGFGRGGFGRGGAGGFGGPGRGGFAGRGGRGGLAGHDSYSGGHHAAEPAEPSPFADDATSGGERNEIIYVRNLPWSTSNEDLVELFQTIGSVERAEIQYESLGRSRGTGVVQFENAEFAETAIEKFSGYQYGGRPLGITYAKYLTDRKGPAADAPNATGDAVMAGEDGPDAAVY